MTNKSKKVRFQARNRGLQAEIGRFMEIDRDFMEIDREHIGLIGKIIKNNEFRETNAN